MKSEILARVRSALGKQGEEQPVARDYRQSGTLDEATRIAQFISRLEDYNAGVHRCSETEIPEAISKVMSAGGKGSLIIPPAFPQHWLPRGVFVPDDQLSYADLDRAVGVLTACTAAISFTGTIILSHSANEGRRALTLIPDYHLCLVFSHQLVETVPEGLRRLRDVRARPITTISGPSATADIEMIRVKGVHGPRFLDVILVA